MPLWIAAIILTAQAIGPGGASHPRLAVIDLVPGGGVEVEVAAALTEAVTTEIAGKKVFTVVSASDIRTALGVERQRQMMACSDGTSCLAELAGAMGARFVLSGTITKLGDAYQLTLKTIDTQTAQPIGRTTRIASDLRRLREQIAFAVAEATATPAPASTVRVLPYALMVSGGLVVVAGSVIGVQALAQESAVTAEQSLGASHPSILKPDSYYQAQASSLRLQKTVGLAGLLAGVATAGLGVYLLVAESPQGNARVALVPSGPGAAVVGSF